MERLFQEPFLQIEVLYVLLSRAVLLVLYKLRNRVLQVVPQHVSRVCLLLAVGLAVVINVPVDNVLLYQLARLVLGVQEGQVAVTVEVEVVDLSRQLVLQLEHLKFNFPRPPPLAQTRGQATVGAPRHFLLGVTVLLDLFVTAEQEFIEGCNAIPRAKTRCGRHGVFAQMEAGLRDAETCLDTSEERRTPGMGRGYARCRVLAG